MPSTRDLARQSLNAIINANPEAARYTEITETSGGFQLYQRDTGQRVFFAYEKLLPAHLAKGAAQIAQNPGRYDSPEVHGSLGAVAAATAQKALMSLAGLDGIAVQIEEGVHKDRMARLSSGTEMTLYHQTTSENGAAILANGFKRGDPGLAGSAIYFAESPKETEHKARHHGFMVVARVKIGRTKQLAQSGQHGLTGEELLLQGYDSVTVPRNGREWVIYFPDQVAHVSGFKCNKDGSKA